MTQAFYCIAVLKARRIPHIPDRRDLSMASGTETNSSSVSCRVICRKTTPFKCGTILSERIPYCTTTLNPTTPLISEWCLWPFLDFKHAPFSMRQVGPMVSVLYPDYLFDQRFECVLLHRQDDFDQYPKLRQSNGGCFFSPA